MEDLWKYVVGDLSVKRAISLPGISNDLVTDAMNLMKIRIMLEDEGFNPDDYKVVENPIEGVYICESLDGDNYFSIHDNNGILEPTYTTKEFDENGCNCFSCETIHESICRFREWTLDEQENL